LPHAKFRGDIDLEAAWQEPPAYKFSVPEEDLHIKFLESYLGASREVLLLRYLVVEGRLNQTVQVLLAEAPGEWILKLDRSCPTLRTAGVKLLLATLIPWFEQRGLEKTASTVEAYESRGRFYEANEGRGARDEG